MHLELNNIQFFFKIVISVLSKFDYSEMITAKKKL